MNAIAKIGFAVFGAVGGFYFGALIAASLGFHEELHVMSAALLSAAALASVGLMLASKSVSDAPTKTRRIGVAIGGIIIAACSFVFFLALVGF